jgi:integrase
MKGHIRERSLGHFAIILDIRDPATGKRKRRWHSFKGTKRQAQIECARLISELQGGTYIDPSKMTVAAFLDRWLDYNAARVSPRTHERYKEICQKNIVPLLGAVRLTKLRPAQISAAWTSALAAGHRGHGGGLSARTVHHMHTVLKSALGRAVHWEILVRNPSDAIDPPRVERKTMTTFDLAQTAELIEALRGDRLLMPVMLAALCGMRRAEIAALRWGRVDLVANQIAIVESAEQTETGIRYKPPKSGKGRTLALSATIAVELRAWRARQAQELLQVGVRQSDDTFVCALEDNSPLRPKTLTVQWARAAARLDLPRIRFHDLRHACATHMLALGVHPKDASERLGHSRVAVTLDLYSHVLPGMQEDAVARVDDALQAAMRQRQKKW